ncbi:MAG: S-adenosylmethionine decarboxylase [Patescibacteria group bacterium]
MNHRNLNRKKINKNGNWGLSASVDLYGCNPKTIRNAKKIKQFVYELCELIDMKRFGKCTVVNFGKDERVAGYSMTQLIETSLISGHFANKTNSAYLDIFSCKYFDHQKILRFAKKFFGAKNYIVNYTLRK